MKFIYNTVTFLAALVVLGYAGWQTYLHWNVLKGQVLYDSKCCQPPQKTSGCNKDCSYTNKNCACANGKKCSESCTCSKDTCNDCLCGCKTSGKCECATKGVTCPCKCGCETSGICNCSK